MKKYEVIKDQVTRFPDGEVSRTLMLREIGGDQAPVHTIKLRGEEAALHTTFGYEKELKPTPDKREVWNFWFTKPGYNPIVRIGVPHNSRKIEGTESLFRIITDEGVTLDPTFQDEWVIWESRVATPKAKVAWTLA